MAALPSPLQQRGELAPLRYYLGIDDGADARAAYYQTIARNLRIADRLEQILDAATARGLVLLPYKGAALAGSLYPEPGTRPMADIDLLVRADELDDAVALLQSFGFSHARAGIARYSPRYTHDVALSDGVVYVELHFALFHELALDATTDELFARATTAPLYDHDRITVSLDDHLMIVALHAATHAYADSPLWLVDVALLLDAGADRARGYTLASQRHGGRAFAIAMALYDHPSLAALWLASPPGRVRSLLARAALVEGSVERARWFGRKLGLTARELLRPGT